MATPNRTYVSDGQVLESLPLSARLSRSVDNIYNFFGLYFVSLFSLDPYTAAQNSQFNTRNRPNSYQTRPRWASSNTLRASGSGGSGPSTGTGASHGARSGPRRPMGTVDDVREPECNSCG